MRYPTKLQFKMKMKMKTNRDFVYALFSSPVLVELASHFFVV